jgi:hypothetical protein
MFDTPLLLMASANASATKRVVTNSQRSTLGRSQSAASGLVGPRTAPYEGTHSMDTDSLYPQQQHQHQQQQHYQANLLPPQAHYRRDSSSSSSGGLGAFLRQHSVGSLGSSHYNPAGNSSSSASSSSAAAGAAGAAKRQRNSFSQMLTSLESELQSGELGGLNSGSSSSSTGLGGTEQYGRSGIGGAANPTSSHLQLFNRPGFCSTLREFAHELQHSSRGLSSNLGSSSEQSGAHGLNLLHTTAVRRRSSLSELYNAARRRSSLSDLIQCLGPIGGQQNGHSSSAAAAAGADASSSDMNGYSSSAANMSLSASGRKRSRAELDFDNPSSSRNMSFGLGLSSGTGSSNNWGLDGAVGAMLRPSIISALTSLNEEHAQQSSGSAAAGADGGDSSGVQRQCSITDWMDGESLHHYYWHCYYQLCWCLVNNSALCSVGGRLSGAS